MSGLLPTLIELSQYKFVKETLDILSKQAIKDSDSVIKSYINGVQDSAKFTSYHGLEKGEE